MGRGPAAAIAPIAYHAFRLFARLFLGKDVLTQNTLLDALPRERWALSACLLFLVVGGLAPQLILSWRVPAVGALVNPAPHQ